MRVVEKPVDSVNNHMYNLWLFMVLQGVYRKNLRVKCSFLAQNVEWNRVVQEFLYK